MMTIADDKEDEEKEKEKEEGEKDGDKYSKAKMILISTTEI